VNATVPRGMDPVQLSLDEAVGLLRAKTEAGPAKGRKAAKNATKKAAKKTAKKVAKKATKTAKKAATKTAKKPAKKAKASPVGDDDT
jgi:topoisomerase IA-like protein